jgi:hypothetical protein
MKARMGTHWHGLGTVRSVMLDTGSRHIFFRAIITTT